MTDTLRHYSYSVTTDYDYIQYIILLAIRSFWALTQMCFNSYWYMKLIVPLGFSRQLYFTLDSANWWSAAYDLYFNFSFNMTSFDPINFLVIQIRGKAKDRQSQMAGTNNVDSLAKLARERQKNIRYSSLWKNTGRDRNYLDRVKEIYRWERRTKTDKGDRWAGEREEIVNGHEKGMIQRKVKGESLCDTEP